MTLISTASPRNVSGRYLRYGGAAALCAAACALIAGCGTGTSTSGAAAAKPLSPKQAITLASDNTSRASSLTGDYTVQVGSAGSELTTGTVVAQIRPTLLVSENLAVSAAGQKLSISEILSARAIYLKEAALSAQTGKPWVKISLSSLSGGIGSALTQLFQSAQNGNPLEQTQMLAAGQNVRDDGTQVVDGVQTTHYSGSFTAGEAGKALSPSLRKSVAPMLNLLSGDITFNAWIDGQHQVRQLIETETVSGEPVTVTMHITSINQPVHISLPPARRVADMPGGNLAGL
jgi:hypothetical protein